MQKKSLRETIKQILYHLKTEEQSFLQSSLGWAVLGNMDEGGNSLAEHFIVQRILL